MRRQNKYLANEVIIGRQLERYGQHYTAYAMSMEQHYRTTWPLPSLKSA